MMINCREVTVATLANDVVGEGDIVQLGKMVHCLFNLTLSLNKKLLTQTKFVHIKNVNDAQQTPWQLEGW